MKKYTTIYEVQIADEGHTGDSFFLKTDGDGRFVPFSPYGDDRGISLHWMTLPELAAWFRRAADECDKGIA